MICELELKTFLFGDAGKPTKQVVSPFDKQEIVQSAKGANHTEKSKLLTSYLSKIRLLFSSVS